MKAPKIFSLAFAVIFGLMTSSCEKSEPAAGESANAVDAESVDGNDHAEGGEEGERIKHLEVPEVTNADDAKKVFLERTAEITGKKALDTQELHEIHMATYHLETAVAYYAENLKGKKKKAAEKIAVVVEEVHLSSEGFKPEEAKKHIAEFTKLAEAFSAGL
ncbi:MAG: hypothetical protein CMO61_09645 [Verrucomicrobiales bacterium]|mgnify:FL=1|jgi:hypothetical protein|nr:hypothetical protein [Verrucomicrobiales bacterium]|tara:strand:- start:18767 stop:19252 length:486 start_codon:yes stop_codon:yes gene_type:complete